MTTITPVEFYDAFCRELARRPACEADLNPLIDFLLSHGIEPRTLDDRLHLDILDETRRHLKKHDADIVPTLGDSDSTWLKWLHPTPLRVLALLDQIYYTLYQPPF